MLASNFIAGVRTMPVVVHAGLTRLGVTCRQLKAAITGANASTWAGVPSRWRATMASCDAGLGVLAVAADLLLDRADDVRVALGGVGRPAEDRRLGQVGDGDRRPGRGRSSAQCSRSTATLRAHGRRVAEQVAGVGVAGHEAQRPPLAGAADEDRHVLLQRARVARRRRHGDAPAVERRRALAPHQRQQLEGVLEQLVALGERRERPSRTARARARTTPRRARRTPARPTARRAWRRSWRGGPRLRYVTPVTSVPRRAVDVEAARNPSVAVLSSMSSHSRPTDGICTKWSITEIDENPTSSAARAIAPSRAAVSAGPPGQVNRPICRPKRSVMGSSSWRRAAAGVS